MDDNVASFVAAVDSSIETEEGDELAELMLLDSPVYPSLGEEASTLADIDGTVAHYAGPTMRSSRCWIEMAAGYLRCQAALYAGELEPAFNACHEALQACLNGLGPSPTNWLVGAMHVLMRGAVSLLRELEKSLEASGAKGAAGELTNSLMATLRTAFSETMNHRLPKDQIALSKTWGALAVANTVVAMLYRADQLNQCSIFQKIEKAINVPPLDQFPRSQTVTYRYYMGMLALYEDKFDRADAMLTAALADCHAAYTGNRRRILTALIAIRMYMRGQVPSDALMASNGLTGPFADLVRAFVHGDMALWMATMDAYRDWYIHHGLYMVLERCLLLVQRTAIKRVCKHVQASTGKAQVPLPLLQAGLRGVGASMDVDEVECVVANLIHRKLIRGYLSHKPPVLVLAKSDAFKPLPKLLAEAGPTGKGPTIADL